MVWRIHRLEVSGVCRRHYITVLVADENNSQPGIGPVAAGGITGKVTFAIARPDRFDLCAGQFDACDVFVQNFVFVTRLFILDVDRILHEAKLKKIHIALMPLGSNYG